MNMNITIDGACKGNPGPGGWAAIINSEERKIISGFSPDTTNNRMELTALLEASKVIPNNSTATIRTDSANVIGWISQGWKRKEPSIRAICQEIDSIIKTKNLQLSFTWVKGHAGDPDNELADRIASNAAKNN
jgi:ribonuclease HI